MKKAIQALAAGAIVFGTSTQAFAVDIGGLEVPVGNVFAVSQIYENVVTKKGDTLSGYGKVDSIDSEAVGNLCTDCELTYEFGGYTVQSINANRVRFTGGWVKFYLGFGADNDFTTGDAGGSAGDLAEATNGTLFLTLTGHAVSAFGHTFIGQGTNIGTTSPSGTGTGLADVDLGGGGIANAYFDTNAVPATFGGGPADFLITSSFSGLFPPYPGECPGGQACVSGSADMRGSVAAIPEPETYALLLAGLGAVAFVARRRKV